MEYEERRGVVMVVVRGDVSEGGGGGGSFKGRIISTNSVHLHSKDIALFSPIGD